MRKATKVPLVLIIGVFFAMILIQVHFLALCGEGLSPLADAFSESHAVRAGERYADQGFLINHGLPDVVYGNRFPEEGYKKISPERKEYIYLHEPPGPDWMTGLLTVLLGKGRLGLFRIWPVAVAMIASAVLAWTLWNCVGPWQAALMLIGCTLVAAFTNMSHGLHHQGYSLSLLILQLALCVRQFSSANRLGAGTLLGMGFIGFLQGWLTFDYLFLITLAPICLWLILGNKRVIPLSHAVRLSLAAGCGFAAAHALHFLQVASYLGSIDRAVASYREALQNTYGVPRRATRLGQISQSLRVYIRALVTWTHLYAPMSVLLTGLALLLVTFHRGQAEMGRTLVRWYLPTRARWGLLIAFPITTLWVLTAPLYSERHVRYVGRHFFLAYFCSLLVLVTCISVTRHRSQVGTDIEDSESVDVAKSGSA